MDVFLVLLPINLILLTNIEPYLAEKDRKPAILTGADPEPPLPGGGTSDQWSRRLPWGATEAPKGGGWRRGSPPPAGGGPGGLPREILENLHQNGAFWAHLEVTYAQTDDPITRSRRRTR